MDQIMKEQSFGIDEFLKLKIVNKYETIFLTMNNKKKKLYYKILK
jgi:hypothetical protein